MESKCNNYKTEGQLFLSGNGRVVWEGGGDGARAPQRLLNWQFKKRFLLLLSVNFVILHQICLFLEVLSPAPTRKMNFHYSSYCSVEIDCIPLSFLN